MSNWFIFTSFALALLSSVTMVASACSSCSGCSRSTSVSAGSTSTVVSLSCSSILGRISLTRLQAYAGGDMFDLRVVYASKPLVAATTYSYTDQTCWTLADYGGRWDEYSVNIQLSCRNRFLPCSFQYDYTASCYTTNYPACSGSYCLTATIGETVNGVPYCCASGYMLSTNGNVKCTESQTCPAADCPTIKSCSACASTSGCAWCSSSATPNCIAPYVAGTAVASCPSTGLGLIFAPSSCPDPCAGVSCSAGGTCVNGQCLYFACNQCPSTFFCCPSGGAMANTATNGWCTVRQTCPAPCSSASSCSNCIGTYGCGWCSVGGTDGVCRAGNSPAVTCSGGYLTSTSLCPAPVPACSGTACPSGTSFCCPSGGTLSGSTCSRTQTCNPCVSYSCDGSGTCDSSLGYARCIYAACDSGSCPSGGYYSGWGCSAPQNCAALSSSSTSNSIVVPAAAGGGGGLLLIVILIWHFRCRKRIIPRSEQAELPKLKLRENEETQP